MEGGNEIKDGRRGAQAYETESQGQERYEQKEQEEPDKVAIFE